MASTGDEQVFDLLSAMSWYFEWVVGPVVAWRLCPPDQARREIVSLAGSA